MGDRGNIVVKDGKSVIWLYTHWDGFTIEDVLRAALKRRVRWDDPSYLTRIIFCEMVKDDPAGTTGYGISTGPQDNNNPVLVVNIKRERVELFAGDDIKGDPDQWLNFEEFLTTHFDREET